VRYFLTGRQPRPSAILLVESGSRGLLEGLIGGLRQTHGPDMFIDLVTCYATPPRGFETGRTRIYRVSDYHGRQGRKRLYRELASNGYTQMGIICSNEPVMLKWKWSLALRLPAKVFAINENGDYFWLDRKHLSTIRQFIVLRAGLAGSGAVRTLAQVFAFPFALAYLILYAAAVHARRALRG
jgi:hypothetical protein